MATITIKYTEPQSASDYLANAPALSVNSALQVGDHVFYTGITTRGGYSVNNATSVDNGNTYVGTVQKISFSTAGQYPEQSIEILVSDTNNVIPGATDYFFFVKDNNVNDAGVLGYYSEVRVENDTTDEAELFSVGTEISESSK
tara:strand:- start:50 stop:481 length:432 start_codon:yes stop_codon:yes gene_type:complete